MTRVEEAIAEIKAALEGMALAHEGLRDFSRLNVSPGTLAAVQAGIEQYDLRKTRLEAALQGAEMLMADGYPVLDLPSVTLSALTDLQQNAASITAALAQFEAMPAVDLNLTVGQAEPKL